MSARRTFLIILAAGAIGVLGWVAFRPQPVPVDLATATTGPLRGTVNADGKTRIRAVYEVSSPIAGTARRAMVAVGDNVTAGQVVAVVEPQAPALLDVRARAEAEAALREAEAALDLAESQARQAAEELAYAQSQYDRIRTLVERGVATTTQLEDATQMVSIRLAAMQAARSSVNMATSARDRAAAVLMGPEAGEAAGGCCVNLSAPVDGTVLTIANISEHAVAPGSPLLTIGRPDDLEIVADLLSADAVGLAPGAPARVERWGGPEALEARLRRIEPSARTRVSAMGIEEQRVDAIFDLVSPPEDRPGLGDGFSVFLRITAWEVDAALQVPVGALFRQDGGWAVFRADDGAARLVPVTVGRMNDTHAEILGGLKDGDRVIPHPSDDLADGVEIRDRARM